MRSTATPGYSALGPRLFALKPQGDIYRVVDVWGKSWIASMLALASEP